MSIKNTEKKMTFLAVATVTGNACSLTKPSLPGFEKFKAIN